MKSVVKNSEPEIVRQASTLPPGWTVTTLQELAGNDGLRADGDWVESKDQDPAGDVRLIQLADIGEGNFRNRSSRFLTSAKAVELGCTFLRKGDILIARMADPIGRACIFPGDAKAAVTVVDVCIFRAPDSRVDCRWLVAILNSTPMRIRVIAMASGTTRGRISGSKLAQIPIPLPPLAEQRRIVARLEALEARSRRARALLAEVPAQLAQARQSLLAAAFRGDLTAEWREANKKPDSPSAANEPAYDGKTLPALPATWRWAALESICETMKIGLVRSSQDQSSTVGVPYIRMQHYDLTGRWHFDDVTRVEVTAAELKEYRLAPGDILFNTRNSSELVGKVGVWPGRDGDHVFNNNLMRLRLRAEHPGFVGHQMQSPQFAERISPLKSATTSVAAIYGRDIKRLPIAIAPLPEQHEIVRRLEAALARLDAAARAHAAAVAELDRLDQSLLARAFSGTLVPQDA